ncbi:hypothetical protein NUKP23_24110 [Klebsiella variicola]|nr:hypothetical protein NUKP23_24110 [Klebsiella variicola]
MWAAASDGIKIGTKLPWKIAWNPRLQGRLRQFHWCIYSGRVPRAANDCVKLRKEAGQIVDRTHDEIARDYINTEVSDFRDNYFFYRFI